MDEKLEPNNEVNNQISENKKETSEEKGINMIENNDDTGKNSASKSDIKNDNDIPTKTIPKPKKELPIEKKPFQEFINNHLIPALIEEINQRGLEIVNINLKNTNRPIAEDKCWVINCEIKDTCNFWLSFEKDDISSLKSISISKLIKNQVLLNLFLLTKKKLP